MKILYAAGGGILLLLPFLMMSPPVPAEDISALETGFAQPPAACRPHTRWWWMGNALTREDIAWQLEQMHAQGIGGVEQITMPPVYEKGNHPYLSPEYFDLLKYAVEKAADLGMEFSLNFGGPGWIWGGEWVPKDDQSKILIASTLSLEGPATYSGPLSEQAVPNPDDLPRSTPVIGPEDTLAKVVAGRIEDGRLCADSLVELTGAVRDRTVTWEVPPGTWQVMAFWFTQRDNSNAVDHLKEGAMRRYCEVLGGRYEAALGEHFGPTVESFFSDSFEVPIFRNGLYWTDGLFEAFQTTEGYDLVPWLPALWYEVDNLSPKVRYDVNHFLHRQGMKAFFVPFVEWCRAHNVRARIQPYGFVTDNVEGAGAADIPEMEITPGEKDAVPWLDTRIGPREYVASGAHLYGRQVVSVEAFTFLHHEPYRETPLELKIATDGFLRAGANKFYNHGFIASPEHDIVPSRGFFEAIRISPENIWWPYYHCVAAYTARCCWMLRQGTFQADVAVYSPLANQWTQSVLNARRWTRDFEWGELGRLLNMNGYAYDLLNDDVLQNRTTFDGPALHAGAMDYRLLILPNIAAIPMDSYAKIEAYVKQGGVVIALERTPEVSTGMNNFTENDAKVRRLSEALFAAPVHENDTTEREYGRGKTFCMDTVLYRNEPLDNRSAAFDPLVNTLRRCVGPDVDIDVPRSGKRTNDGLVFLHRRADSMDLYFVANIQDAPFVQDVGFRISKGQPWDWDPHTGARKPMGQYRRDESYTRIPLSLAPYDSRLICFEKTNGTGESPHLTRSDFIDVLDITRDGFDAATGQNGVHTFEFFDGAASASASVTVGNLPAVYTLNGTWRVRFEGRDAPAHVHEWPELQSWTDLPDLAHFSGKGCYALTFNLPGTYLQENTRLRLSLGAVGVVAEIRLNGHPVGIHWRPGQYFEIETLVQAGENTLEVDVTNTLINRVSGLKALPELAPELQPLYGGDLHPPHARAVTLMGFQPLPASGLLGPVQVTPLRTVHFTTGHGVTGS